MTGARSNPPSARSGKVLPRTRREHRAPSRTPFSNSSPAGHRRRPRAFPPNRRTGPRADGTSAGAYPDRVTAFLVALVPTIGVLFIFWIGMRALVQADRRELPP